MIDLARLVDSMIIVICTIFSSVFINQIVIGASGPSVYLPLILDVFMATFVLYKSLGSKK